MNLGSFRILLPFFWTSWDVGVLNSAIFNSFHNTGWVWQDFGGPSEFRGGGWTHQTPPRYASDRLCPRWRFHHIVIVLCQSVGVSGDVSDTRGRGFNTCKFKQSLILPRSSVYPAPVLTIIWDRASPIETNQWPGDAVSWENDRGRWGGDRSHNTM